MGTFVHGRFDSGISAAARQRAAGLVALCAIFLHIAVPAVLTLAAPSAHGLIKTVICSGGVTKEIYLDQDGNPVKQAPSGEHEDCKFSCVHHCAAMAATAIGTVSPVRFALPVAAAAFAASHSLAIVNSHPRAPPA